jgi:XTP/dITP diphosphohydrolase
MKLVMATSNTNKILEIRDKFSDITNLALITLDTFKNPPVIIEDGATFHENAHKKAAGIAEFTGLASMADDSGLVIDALDGYPGIFSARFGGENVADNDRNRMILEKIQGIPADRRSARFVCVIAIAVPGGHCHFSVGKCDGFIADAPRGSNGFGYDPIFYLPDIGKTMAELTLEEKNKISHRAKALEAAKELLRSLCV